MFMEKPVIGKNVRGARHLWSPILHEWSIVLDRYARLAPDLPQNHGERANVGFLAAATWRLAGKKNCALVEYGDNPESSTKGLTDLWMKVGRHDACVEVKHCWVNNVSELVRVKRRLRNAEVQLDKRDRSNAKQGMVICFVSLSVERSQPRLELQPLLELTHRFSEDFSGPKSIVGVSWLPNDIRLDRRRDDLKGTHVPTGMALVGRQVWP
jgi:hypothetical protein